MSRFYVVGWILLTSDQSIKMRFSASTGAREATENSHATSVMIGPAASLLAFLQFRFMPTVWMNKLRTVYTEHVSKYDDASHFASVCFWLSDFMKLIYKMMELMRKMYSGINCAR